MTRIIPEEATFLERAYEAILEIQRTCEERIQQCLNVIFYEDVKKEELEKLKTTVKLCKEFLLIIEEYLSRRDEE
jgi:hypothetical protein